MSQITKSLTMSHDPKTPRGQRNDMAILGYRNTPEKFTTSEEWCQWFQPILALVTRTGFWMLLSRILGELLKQALKNKMMLRGQISHNISEVFKEVASLNYKHTEARPYTHIRTHTAGSVWPCQIVLSLGKSQVNWYQKRKTFVLPVFL